MSHQKYQPVSFMAKILVIHGPNLNTLGQREPEIYGNTTLESINKQLIDKATPLGFELDCFQSNQESQIIEKLHQTTGHIDYLIINPAALTHTSIALRDAVLSVNVPFVEVHISNIFTRETFRKHSFFSDIAVGLCSGLGYQGYLFALDFAIHQLSKK